MQATIDNLKHTFPEKLNTYHIQHTNELYLEIDPINIQEFCIHLQKDLEGTLVSLFANDERQLNGNFALYYVWAIRRSGFFVVLKTQLKPDNPVFQSITTPIYAANLYEREIKDLFGLIPEGHPDPRDLCFHGNWPQDLYPLRKDFDTFNQPTHTKTIDDFQRVAGEGVYEIPVGPVHAGIIEPGHFRFSVAGEPIINLEARLHYVHKGIEKLAEGLSIDKCLYLSERISGDETFANSLAYCHAIEKIAGIELSPRAAYTRLVFAELERLTSHLGDLAGICVDVAYGFAAYQFRMLRGWCYILVEELAHSRFLRNINTPGGVRQNFLHNKEKQIIDAIARIKKELNETVKILKTNALFIDRIENTGILTINAARDLNTVGPPGRASGLHFDLRKNFPYSNYNLLDFQIPKHLNGDVNCRINVKIEECYISMEIILKTLELMPQGETIRRIGNLDPYQSALGYSEAPRGENIHWVMTGENNTIYRYKIRTPSFCNWPALCWAVNGNIVPDFPLINKSFNLSYAGNDL
ncbi:MAG: pyridine nucleotide-disulfide oxidoreductase [Firmicutes bacterium HGW-Firmicutes-12]|nr:MAG: pyridine nucleotide-disulfide oxidoreductase [Firmicutes bacterium HGW-Firmicutes-12]